MKPTPYYLRATLLALPAVLIGLQLMYWVFSTTTEQVALSDFPHHYRIGQMLISGRAANIYDTTSAVERQICDSVRGATLLTPQVAWDMPYLHPSFEAPLFSLFSLLPIQRAYPLWVLLNCLVMFCIYRVLLPHLSTLATMRPWIPASLLLAFAYIPRAALHGQDSVILLLILCGSFSFIVKGDLLAAGIVLGLGSFRFQHMLFIVVLFLAWKRWKLAAGYFATGFGCALVSLAITGLKGQIEYVHLLSRASHWPIREEMDNLRGVFAWLGISDAYTPVLLLSFLGLAAFLGRNMSLRNQFLFAIVALTLGSYYLFYFDMSVLFLPVVMLLEDALADGRPALASFFLVVFSAPVWVLLVVKFDQAQAMTAVVLIFFAVLWVKKKPKLMKAAAFA